MLKYSWYYFELSTDKLLKRIKRLVYENKTKY